MSCTHCGKPLRRSQTRDNGRLKSCPNCSNQNPAREHVFHTADSFGASDKRVTDEHPDGVQSWCVACRTKQGPVAGVVCSAA